jgi:FlaA1/EpsC-like NDP-sugar epimerase
MPSGRILIFALLAGLAWSAIAFVCGLSARQELRSWASGIPDAARLFTTSLVMSWAFVGLAALCGGSRVLLAALGGPAAAILTSALRALARSFVHRLAPLRQRTLIIGSGHVAGEVTAALVRHGEIGLEPIGIVDDDVYDAGGPSLTRLGGIADLPTVLREHSVDRVIIAFSRATHDDLLRCIRLCRDGGVAIDIVPRLFEFLDGAHALDQIGSMPLVSMGVPQLSRASQAVKRLVDLVGAGLGIMALSPLLAGTALTIKLTSPGPVLFRQSRTGRDGEPFALFKFRSMYADASTARRS